MACATSQRKITVTLALTLLLCAVHVGGLATRYLLEADGSKRQLSENLDDSLQDLKDIFEHHVLGNADPDDPEVKSFLENHYNARARNIFDAFRPGNLSSDALQQTLSRQKRNLFAFDRKSSPHFRLPFSIDPACTDPSKYYFRQLDGSCNWLKEGEHRFGAAGTAFSRDVEQTSYADGISEPRKGPNPRTLSNVFFKEQRRPKFNHTPFLVGLIAWVIHDLAYSVSGTEPGDRYEMPMPSCDPFFDPECNGNATLEFVRSARVNGTGTSKENPRQTVNGATAWMDASPLYGVSEETNHKLRNGTHGKLKYQIGPDGGMYPPFNSFGLPVSGPPGREAQSFAAGDVRQNQDWFVMSIHTLMLREHNRICDILVSLYPKWDDERLFQTARVVITAKLMLIANGYQMTYFTKEMESGYGWPSNDGYPLYRMWHKRTAFTINPYHTYPWKYTLDRNGKPVVPSQEMTIGYQFHDLIPETFKVIRGENKESKKFLDTLWDTQGFLNTGIEPIILGMADSDIPDFRAGIAESLRSLRFNLRDPKYGNGFDLAAWAIEHERERGLPTFNQYFRSYDGKVSSPPRKTFEEFTSNEELQRKLRELYETPDDVDLLVGQQLDETYFEGTTVPTSALITSLFSLFGVGNSDRFQPGYSLMQCLLVDKPWSCTPSNALDALLWEDKSNVLFPKCRWFNKFWLEELDLSFHGTNGLWYLVTKNTNIKCVQRDPLFPMHPETNPVVCAS